MASLLLIFLPAHRLHAVFLTLAAGGNIRMTRFCKDAWFSGKHSVRQSQGSGLQIHVLIRAGAQGRWKRLRRTLQDDSQAFMANAFYGDDFGGDGKRRFFVRNFLRGQIGVESVILLCHTGNSGFENWLGWRRV